MSVFTAAEIAFLQSQTLGHMATIDADGELHVVPCSFRYNPEHDSIDLGGRGFGRSRKFRDVARYGRAAFVVDDHPTPGVLHGLEVRGPAAALPEGGPAIRAGFDPQIVRITPTRIASWGLDTGSYEPRSRTVR